jgi:hypothetical protein
MANFFKKTFNKIFANKHSMITNSVFFMLLLMLLYILILLPFMVFFFVQNPNVFNEAESEIYLNKDELYKFASSMELYAGFFVTGSLCEIVRRAISTKVGLLHNSLFLGYLCFIAGELARIIAYLIMMNA